MYIHFFIFSIIFSTKLRLFILVCTNSNAKIRKLVRIPKILLENKETQRCILVVSRKMRSMGVRRRGQEGEFAPSLESAKN